MSQAPPQRSIAPRNLTSLVDTVFLLVFSLLAMSEARRPDATDLVRVELPAVERGEPTNGSSAQRVVLHVTDQSEIFLGHGGPAISSRAELDAALTGARGERLPEELVIDIEADRDSHYGVAVELLQHLRLTGFVHVRLVATGEPGPLGPFGTE